MIELNLYACKEITKFLVFVLTYQGYEACIDGDIIKHIVLFSYKLKLIYWTHKIELP